MPLSIRSPMYDECTKSASYLFTTTKAIAEIQECACKNGGNAMVFLGDAESGFHSGFGYSQQRVKARAIVLFVFPKETP